VTEKQRQCRCGAIYHRTEAMAASREIDSFECTACGVTLETWDTAWVPTYRRIAEPAIEPDQQADMRAQADDRNTIPSRRS
jgi:hypothetical protein